MMTETKKTRKAILMSTRKAVKAKRITSATGWALKHRLFPLSFFVRNMLALQREPWWTHMSPRVRKTRLLMILEQRCRIFLEVRKWVRTRQGVETWRAQAPPAREEQALPSGYCSNCGGCCEIASGFPDFPPEAEIPRHWQRIFGDGLGKGHRFCAFLWELYASGQSFCAIHPWRSNPCRVFEEDECEYFTKDLKTNALFDPKAFSVACHRLSHLVNRG
jgi:hypothetical protein